MRKQKLTLVVTFVLVILFSINVHASLWEVVSSIHTVNQLVLIDDEIWGATNSGLFKFSTTTEEFQLFTTVHGLSSMKVEAMVEDNHGNLILGMGNAYIDIFDLETYNVTRYSALHENGDIFQINALHNHGGDIYIAHDIGVSKLVYYENLGSYQIEGTYRTLGNLTPETSTYALQVFEGGLWVGTEMGLARGDLSQAVLESPANWTNYTTLDGLSANNIKAFTVYHDSLYLASSGGDYGIDKLITLEDGFQGLQLSYTSGIQFMTSHDDTLYFGRSNGIYRLVNNNSTRVGSPDAKALSLVFDENNRMWGGFSINKLTNAHIIEGGLKVWSDGEWVLKSPEGAQAEIVTDILVQDSQSIWVVGKLDLSYNNGVLCHYDGEHWTNLGRSDDNYGINEFVSPDSFFWHWTRRITDDADGSVWVASDGRGVGWFEFNGDTILAKDYYTTDSGKLFNISSNSHWCVARDITTDIWGNIWICNSEANADKPIVVVPAAYIEDPIANPLWGYLDIFQPNGQSLPSAEYYIDRMAIDSYNRKWFGGNNNTPPTEKGIWLVDDNGTIMTDSDDYWVHLTGLPSDSITALTMDRDGVMWVGTPAGVQYFYPSEDPQYLSGNRVDLWGIPVDNSINVIAVDPQNNKWFGTNKGLSILSSDNFTWLASYTDIDGDYPSPLPGNAILAIAFDSETGDAFIGTEEGLAILSTPYKEMGSKVTDVSLITDHNPFIIGDGSGERLHFDSAGLSETVEMKIFSTAGFLVRELAKNEIILGWDGRNSRGELVGSGIYLLLAYDPDGNAETGKVAIIHK